METFKAVSFLQILVQYYRYGDAVNILQPLYMAAFNLGENSGQNSTTFYKEFDFFLLILLSILTELI
jgi:hypothetical protein